MIKIIITWLVRFMKYLIKLFEGKYIKYGLFLKALFFSISLIKRFKTFKFVRYLIIGFGIVNLILSIFIIISFSDIDFSKFEIPALSYIISILIGIFPVFFTDSAFYINSIAREKLRVLLCNIIENVITPELNNSDEIIDYDYVFEEKGEDFSNDNDKNIDNDKNKDIDNDKNKDIDTDTENKNKNNKTKYLLILAAVTVIGLGVVYYYHPEYYTLMYEYISSIFNRRGGDPDPGTNNNADNNISNEKLKGKAVDNNISSERNTGKAVYTLVNKTVNRVTEGTEKSIHHLWNIKENFDSTHIDDLLKKTKELLSRNNKILDNFKKVPERLLLDSDKEKFNELVNINNRIKEFIEREENIVNSNNIPSTSYSETKEAFIESVPSSPEVMSEELTDSVETIKPRKNKTILDFFNKKDTSSSIPSNKSLEDKSSIYIKDERTNLEDYPTIPETEEGYPDSDNKSKASVNTVEKRVKFLNFWKRFKSDKPPVGESTINPEYIPLPLSSKSSTQGYPSVPDFE